MRSTELGELAAFVIIVQQGNFRRAAASLNVKPSTLSHSMRALEERLGIRLLNRTTRKLSLTEAGQVLFEQVVPAFGRIDNAIEMLNRFRVAPTGTVRLNMPRVIAAHVLLPKLQAFQQHYSDIRLEIAAENRFADIVGEGFDAGIRLGKHLERDMVAVRITPDIKIAVVGSPDYFACHPKPKTPQDLHLHQCINRRTITNGGIENWVFEQHHQTFSIEVSGGLILDDADLIVDAAVQGLGLAYSAEELVTQQLEEGKLIQVLSEYSPSIPGFFLYYSDRRISAALRALVDTLRVDESALDSLREDF